MLTASGEERTFIYNINNYDFILLYVQSSNTVSQNTIYPPTIIDKSDFNKEVNYYISGYSNTMTKCQGLVKIDIQNNKICWLDRGDTEQKITKVIGMKL